MIHWYIGYQREALTDNTPAPDNASSSQPLLTHVFILIIQGDSLLKINMPCKKLLTFGINLS